jgi:hypothetical protein
MVARVVRVIRAAERRRVQTPVQPLVNICNGEPSRTLGTVAPVTVRTLGELRQLSSASPDAPKWWLGDWANEGTRRFGVTIEQAVDAGRAVARSIGRDFWRGSLELPVSVEADVTSLRLPSDITREAWERLGAFLFRVHDEIDPSSVSRTAVFKIGDVYPADDLLSEWLATIAMAANDLIAVHVLMADADDDFLRWYYFRAAVGHFYEVAKHLDETEHVAEVKAFVNSLPQPPRDSYAKVLAVFRQDKAHISNLRNSVFHYPSMMNSQRPGVLLTARALPKVLRSAAHHESHVRLGRLKDARLVFADELTARLAIRSVGTVRNLEKLQFAVQEGVQDFMRFMNPALEEHMIRRQLTGAVIRYER